MNKEIERKFAIKYLPKDLKIESNRYTYRAFIYRDNLNILE